MKRDKRIAFLSVLVILFAVAAVFLFGKAFTGRGEGNSTVQVESSESTDSGEKNVVVESSPGVDFAAQSVSVEEFNALFTGEGVLKVERHVIEGIPVNIFYQNTQTTMPLIIMQHGLTANKESVSELAKSFALQGYVVISPDAVGHGELGDGVYRTLPEIIQGSAENFNKIIEFCCQSEYVDESRVGLCGVSMGALTSLYYSAYGEHEIKATVSFCGTPDFASFAGMGAVEHYYSIDGSSAEEDKDKIKAIEEAMTSLSPYDTLLNEKATALFLMCGAADNVVPPEGNAAFYQEAIAADKKVSLVVKENQGHTLELDEMYAALAFMVENL